MRNKNGYDTILAAIEKLAENHEEHMEVYGYDNELRMTGNHETSNFNLFSHGVGNRCTSVRIPTLTFRDKKGYFEDRRPASNCDPYLVTHKIFETIL